MQPIQHPEIIKMIHQAMVDDEMHRNGHAIRQPMDLPGPRPGDQIRIAIGKALIALGSRIEPQRERGNQPAPAVSGR